MALLVCLCWQANAAAHSIVAVPGDGDLAHALLHWTDKAHHHHDGDVHLDDSEESVAHGKCDHLGGATVALLSETQVFADVLTGGEMPRMRSAPVPLPYLDGLLRPPQA